MAAYWQIKGKQLQAEAIQNHLTAMFHAELNRGKTLNTVEGYPVHPIVS